jgi:uncharacterized membrane protein YkoI
LKFRTLAPALFLACAIDAGAEGFELPKTSYSMEHCLQVVQNRMPSKLKAVELESKGGRFQYEFEIVTIADGVEWDVECSADTGEITWIERDVKPEDAAFRDVAKLTLVDALAVARARFPGLLTDVEYEVGPDGRAWYEFTLQANDGTRSEVMVDAATGEVMGVDDDRDEREYYRIGAD